MSDNKISIIIALIGMVGMIAAAIIGAKWGQDNFNIAVQLDGKDVLLKDADVQEIALENEELKKKVQRYEDEMGELESLNEKLNSDLDTANKNWSGAPEVSFENYGFVVNGEDKNVGTENSMVKVNGREYFSKDFLKGMLDEGQSLTVEDNTLFIGPVIADKADLFEQIVMDTEGYVDKGVSGTDSFGNEYINALSLDGGESIMYNLKKQYSKLKFTIAVTEYSSIDGNGIVKVKADDDIVYTSPKFNKQTEPFSEVSIPINNCTFLSIIYESDGDVRCLMPEAEVYN
ncbi:MAG: hypothetical protein HFH61_02560 [Lachnospiraceae bacterium]|nr:hypothetical protein [Lachnospiraceae bacterium]